MAGICIGGMPWRIGVTPTIKLTSQAMLLIIRPLASILLDSTKPTLSDSPAIIINTLHFSLQTRRSRECRGRLAFLYLLNPDATPALTVMPVVHHGVAGRAYYVSRYRTDEVLVWALTDPLEPSHELQRVEVKLV